MQIDVMKFAINAPLICF